MNAEIRARIDRQATVYENRILVVVVLITLIVCACLSFYTVKALAGDKFDPARGDRAVVTCELTYYGHQVAQVAAWVDREGVTHYARETPKLAGFEVPVLVLILINLGLFKAGYDTYGFLAGRYRRRLIARFHYRLDA